MITLPPERRRPPTVKQQRDIKGLRFNHLTVLRRSDDVFTAKRWRPSWLCLCDCGETAEYASATIQSMKVKSCGCVRRENSRRQNITHGFSRAVHNHQLYKTYKNMVYRCMNKKAACFHNYGGRGIQISNEWLDIHNFIRDMECSWSPGMTIERIDNNGNYEKSNCRWATKREQCANMRRTVLISFNGVTKHLAEWSRTSGVCSSTISQRILRGWSAEKAIFTPAIK